jgi:thioredoxin reductase (NADPH)
MNGNHYELIIRGTGPAGLQAAIHAAWTKVSVLVLGRQPKSSLFKAHIENYCCLRGVTGESLLLEGHRQAERSGARFINEDVLDLEGQAPEFKVRTESGEIFSAKAVIRSISISRNKLGVPGEKELPGKGVSYCVEGDANFYRDLPVAVVGGESAAAGGELTLLLFSPEVHLIWRQLDVAEKLSFQIRKRAIHLHEGRSVKEIQGTRQVEGLGLDDGSSLKVESVFIELGAKGAIELASDLGVLLDSESLQYIVTDKKQETNVPGIYAAGDICGPPWQMAKAVGEGCAAGLQAAAFAKKHR